MVVTKQEFDEEINLNNSKTNNPKPETIPADFNIQEKPSSDNEKVIIEPVAPIETKTEKLEIQPAKESQESKPLAESIKSLSSRLRLTKKKPTVIPQVRDELTIKIENLMEEGLKDAFVELSTIQKQQFKIKGEQTAFEIRNLLKATHIKVKKIFQLILEWLKILPGINRFFLEQEAKIKADKIIALKNIEDSKK